MYFTDYVPPPPFWTRAVLRAVFELDLAADSPPRVFAGRTGSDAEGAAENGQLILPASVACDRSGRVHVADHLGDEISIYLSDGTLLTSVPVRRPVLVSVAPDTGEMLEGYLCPNRRVTVWWCLMRAGMKCLKLGDTAMWTT
ncbi:MAG: hypothetical protein N2255_02095 [Kiritimatiellae bacterium]|nr:hypothetical protein [Kiritimatiellia bacterium]